MEDARFRKLKATGRSYLDEEEEEEEEGEGEGGGGGGTKKRVRKEMGAGGRSSSSSSSSSARPKGGGGVMEIVRRQSKCLLQYPSSLYPRYPLTNHSPTHPSLPLSTPPSFTKTVIGQLPPSHPAFRNKAFALSTLPVERVLGAGAGAGAGEGGGGAAAAQEARGGCSGDGGGGGRGGGGRGGGIVGGGGGEGGRAPATKQEKDKKTIARIKKLIKYKR